MAARPSYCIRTLGCKANLYDSRRIAEALEHLGFEEATASGRADIVLVNTCTVTAAADRKSRHAAYRAARRHPGARVFVTGCGASTVGRELHAAGAASGAYSRDQWDEPLHAVVGGPTAPTGIPRGDFGIAGFPGRARAFLKVQEGCDGACSYCIVPATRGPSRSRPPDEAREEAARLVSAGFRELVVTGIHLGRYGWDLDGHTRLPDLVHCLAEVDGLERLRLSSVQPQEVDQLLLEAMRHPVVCPHLHLPLQSGDARVLLRMNRPYSPRQFLDVVALVRERLDRPAITTDVIVGFPGESAAAFANTVDVVRHARFCRVHVFPFSPRPGTPAARMPGRVPARQVGERARRLRAVAEALAQQWATSFVGSRVRVLLERRQAGLLAGYTDRYVRACAPGQPDRIGDLVTVRVTAREGTSLTGRVDR
jgi:threonylcarbamoyladenosine tRNA methylthiotransferase MtaB